MTYGLIVPPSIRRQIRGLSAGDQAELITLFDRLPVDPDQATGVFGLDVPGPYRMRSVGLSRLVVIVYIDDLAQKVTVMRIDAPPSPADLDRRP
ncbi:hypothetical protein [Streptomyces sp. NPDC059786]|uniref:hypothetical protein n=1 Tax=Streptomyces sp. NPDC059786 TaxID=3346946 RepID=UPI0036576A99